MRWARLIACSNEVNEQTHRLRPVEWLSAAELKRFQSIRPAATARDWLAARWCVKRLIIDHVNSRLRMSDIHVESRDGRDRGTRPRAYVTGRLQPWALTISHAEDLIAAAVMLENGGRIGVDVTSLGLGESRLDFWLCDSERQWCDRGVHPTILWSLKEAFYKAINRGEPFRPRQIDVSCWLTLAQCLQIGSSEQGDLSFGNGLLHWQVVGEQLVSFVALAPVANNRQALMGLTPTQAACPQA